MADFQVSLSTGTGTVALSASGGVLTIPDYSNYLTSTEPGHLTADFSLFKKIYVTDPEDVVYEYSTLGTGDELVSPPSTFGTTPIDDTYVYTSDGVFKVVLMSVPTHSLSVAYQLNDCVYYGTGLYRALTSTTATDPSTSTDWEAITESELPDKYSVTESIAIVDVIQTCWAQAVYDANCSVDGITVAVCEGEDLCKNKTWRRAVRMEKILSAIQYFVNLEDWKKVQDLIDRAGTICNCT